MKNCVWRKSSGAIDGSSNNTKGPLINILAAGLLGVSAAALSVSDGHAQFVPFTPTDGSCLLSAAVLNCSGDLTAGVSVMTNTMDVLNVNNLTPGGIMPAPNLSGVFFAKYGQDGPGEGLTINVDTTGSAGIKATGWFAGGIEGAFSAYQGDLTINSTGNIVTDGFVVDGIVAESEAYMGNLNGNSKGDITTKGNDSFGFYIENDNMFGNTNIDSEGNIETHGEDSVGIFVNSSSIGELNIVSKGDVTTKGEDANGIEAIQNRAFENTTIDSTGNITTEGEGSIGIYMRLSNRSMYKAFANEQAEMVGPVFPTVPTSTAENKIHSKGDIATSGYEAHGIGVEAFGNVGSVEVISEGNISTQKDESIGIGIEAVGGFGLLKAKSVGDISTKGDFAAGIAVLRQPDFFRFNLRLPVDAPQPVFPEEAINIESIGNISTEGTGAFGILAVAPALAGDINISSEGSIKVSGDQTAGIYAISQNFLLLAPIEDDFDMAQNANIMVGPPVVPTDLPLGNINVAVKGTVEAAGQDAFGILTFGGYGSQNMVNLTDATVKGGSGIGAALFNVSELGSTHEINTYGNVTLSSLSGTAIASEGSSTTINNFGTLNTVEDGAIVLDNFLMIPTSVESNMNLAGPMIVQHTFNNMVGGTFNSGEIVNLGTMGMFNNYGALSVGGAGNIQTTNITGDLVQTSTGSLKVDVSLAEKKADLLNVSGTADLNGLVDVNILDIGLGAQEHTILSADGGVTENGLALLGTLSPLLQAELLYPNANDVVLSVDLDLTAPGTDLNQNQTNVANALEDALAKGSPELESVLTAILNGIVDLDAYQQALDQLGAESILNGGTTAAFAAQIFMDQLFSCQVSGTQYAAISEGNCVWFRPQAEQFEHDATAANVGFDGFSRGVSMGVQSQVADNLYAGLAFGYDDGGTTSNAGASSSFQGYNAGAALKYTKDGLLISGALTAGMADFDTVRNINIGALAATNTGNYDVRYFSARLRAAYLYEQETHYFKPLIDLNVTHLNRDGFTEAGNAATALTVSGDSHTNFSVSPAVEVGYDRETGDGEVLRVYGKVGATITSDDKQSLTAQFANGSAFTSTTQSDNVFADVEAGFTVLQNGAAKLQLGYQGRFSENTRQHGGFLKANVSF